MRLLSWLLWAAAAIVPVISTEETSLSRPKRESSEKKIVCYYVNWSVYRPGTAKFSPQNINPYLCTHLIYAFGGLTKDNALKPFDRYQDIEQGGYAKFNGLKTYNKNLKTMIAIGGWNEGSARFSPLAADSERRKEFVKNTVRFLRQNHFDGLDLDWEYPSFRDGGKPRDRENYATLVQEFREEFERESEKTGRPRLLLTMAVPAGIEYIDKGYDVKKLNKYLDWMNILSYDYHSAIEPAVNHHSPLYSLEEDDEYSIDAHLNIDHTVRHYIKLGADRNKLVLGIPTYGRSYTLFNPDATDIGDPADGPGEQGEATREKGYLSYYEICDRINNKGWTVDNSNSDVMGPFAYKDNQWVGYDDENIVRAKAKYVNDMDLGGIMFWSIDNDDFRGKCHGKAYPLIEAGKEALLADANELLPSSNESKERGKSNSRKTESTTTGTKRKSRLRGKTATSTESGRTKSARTSTTTPQPPTTPDPGSDFTCKEEGFFPHPRDCKKYFWCLDSGPSSLGIVAHQFTCPSGLVFNKISDSCDYARNVICKNKPETTTTSTTTTTTTTTTTPRTTTSKSRVITASPPRTTTTTTTTTAKPSEEEYEEYEDDEEEDPGTIKELINLIKKLGGVEQLEKQLNLQGTDDKTGIKPSLYSKVLQGRSGNRYRGVTPETSTSRNRPNAPQSPESSETGEDSRSADKPKYVTIQRNRSRPQSSEEEEEEDERSESEDSRSGRKSGEKRRRKRPNSDATTEKEYVTLRRARPLKEETTTSKYRNIVRTRSTTPATIYREEDDEEEGEEDNSEETEEGSEDTEEEVTVEEKEPVQKQKKYSSIIRDNKRIVSEVEESKVSGEGENDTTPETKPPESTTVNSVNKVATPKYTEIRRGQSSAKTETLTNDVNNVNSSFESGYLLKNSDSYRGSENEIQRRRLNGEGEALRSPGSQSQRKDEGNESKPSTGSTETKRFRFAPRQRPTILSPVAENSNEDISSASEVFTIVVPDPTAPTTIIDNDIPDEKFIITVTPSPRVVTESTTQSTTGSTVNVTAQSKSTESSAVNTIPVDTTTAGSTPTSTETTVVTSITESIVTERRKISRKKRPKLKTNIITSTTTTTPSPDRALDTTTEAHATYRRFRTTAKPSTTPGTTTTAQVRGFRFRVKPTSIPNVETTSEKRFIPKRGRNFQKALPPAKAEEVEEKKEEKPTRFQPRRPRPPSQNNTEERTQTIQRPVPRRPLFPTRRTKYDLDTQQSGSFFKDEDNENSLTRNGEVRPLPGRSRYIPGYLQRGPFPEDDIVDEEEEIFESEEENYDSEEDNEEGDQLENDNELYRGPNSHDFIAAEDKNQEDDDSPSEEENPPAPVQSINDRFFKGRTRPTFEVSDAVKIKNQNTPENDNKRVTSTGRSRFGVQFRDRTNGNADKEPEEQEESEETEKEEAKQLLNEPGRKYGGRTTLEGSVNRRLQNQTRDNNQQEKDNEGGEVNPFRPRRPLKRPVAANDDNSNIDSQLPVLRIRNQQSSRLNTQVGDTDDQKITTTQNTTENTINTSIKLTTPRIRTQFPNRVTFRTNTTTTVNPPNRSPVQSETESRPQTRARNQIFGRVTPQVNTTTVELTNPTVAENDSLVSKPTTRTRNQILTRVTTPSTLPTTSSPSIGSDASVNNSTTARVRSQLLGGGNTAIPPSNITVEPTAQSSTDSDTTTSTQQLTTRTRFQLRNRPNAVRPNILRNSSRADNIDEEQRQNVSENSSLSVNIRRPQLGRFGQINGTNINLVLTREENASDTVGNAVVTDAIDLDSTQIPSEVTEGSAVRNQTRTRIAQRRPVLRKRVRPGVKQQELPTTTEKVDDVISTTNDTSSFDTRNEIQSSEESNTKSVENQPEKETSEEFSNEIFETSDGEKNRTRVLLKKRIGNRQNDTRPVEVITTVQPETPTVNRTLTRFGNNTRTIRRKIIKGKAKGIETVEENKPEATKTGPDYTDAEAFRPRKPNATQTELPVANERTVPVTNRTRVLFKKKLRAKLNVTDVIRSEDANEIENESPQPKARVLLRNPSGKTEDDSERGNRTRILLRKRLRNRQRGNEITDADDQLEAEAGRVIPSPFNSLYTAGKDVTYNSSRRTEAEDTTERVTENGKTAVFENGVTSSPERNEDNKEGSEVPPSTTRTGPNFVRRGNQDFILKRRNKTTTTTTQEPVTSSESPRRKNILTERRRFRPESRTLPPKPEVETETTVTSSIRQTPFTRRRVRPKSTTTTTTTTEAYKPEDSKLEESQDSSNIPDLADPAVVAIHNLATVSPVPVAASPSPILPVRFGPATPSGFSLQYSPVTVTENPSSFSTPARPAISLLTRQPPSIRTFIPAEQEPKLSTPVPLRTTALRVKPALFTTDDSFVTEVSVQPRRTSQKPRAFTPALKEPEKPRKPKPFTKVQKRPAAVIETDDETQPYDYQVYDDVDEDPLANVPASALKVKVHSDGYIECLDRGNFPHPFSCKKFISCARMENNELLGWEYTCPKHLSFDPVGGICNWSAGLGCQH